MSAKLPLMSIFCIGILFSGTASAETYFISPTGNDSNVGSSNLPWGTFGHAMPLLQAGDTLVLKDGTYKQSLSVTTSGEQGNPITIRAENDGGALVDGEYQRTPLRIRDRHDIEVEGISFRNSDDYVIDVYSSAHVVLRRLTAANAGDPNANYHQVQVVSSSDVLVEDVAAFGRGRTVFLAYESDHVTFRRCFAYWQDYGTTPYILLNVYGSSDTTVENCVGTMAPDANNNGQGVMGIGTWMNTQNVTVSSRNRFYGNVVYDLALSPAAFWSQTAKEQIDDNQFRDNVALGVSDVSASQWCATYQLGGRNILFDHMTIAGFPTGRGFVFDEDAGNQYTDITGTSGEFKNSIFTGNKYGLYANDSDGSLNNHHNNFHNMQSSTYLIGKSAGIGDVAVDPGFDTATYGKGGYLFLPKDSLLRNLDETGSRMGAEVLYRYENGQLTNQPLWPWPMETRIQNELGVSVTWETNGGLWKTLDGVYEGGSTMTDTIPDTFSFADQTGVDLSATIISNPIAISGINAPAGISVSGGEYSVNSGAFTSAAGTVNNGDSVQVRHTSSAQPETTVGTTLTIGGVSDTFSSTTIKASTNTVSADMAMLTFRATSTPKVGKALGFNFVIQNNGTGVAANARFVLPLPVNMSWVSGPSECTSSVDEVTCSFGDLAKGISRNRYIYLRPSVKGPYTLTGSALSDTDDNLLTNNNKTVDLTVN